MHPGMSPSPQGATTQIGTIETEIDGHHYEMAMLPGSRGWRMYLRILKMLGPSLGKVVDGVIQGGGDLSGRAILQKIMDMEGISKDFVSEAVVALTEHVNEDEVSLVMTELAKVTWADRQHLVAGANFDVHFQGRPLSIMKWLAWGLQVQYGGFSNASESVAAPGAGTAGPSATEARAQP